MFALDNVIWTGKGILNKRANAQFLKSLFKQGEPGALYTLDGVANTDWRRNLIDYTDQFGLITGKSTLSNATVASTNELAPDGGLTASKIIEDTATAAHAARRFFTPRAGVTYTASVFVKPAGIKYLTLLFLMDRTNGDTYASAQVNLETGQVINNAAFLPCKAAVTPAANGFYRVTLTASSPLVSGTNLYFDFRFSNVWPITANAGGSYTGDGQSGVIAWGWQIEEGSVATDYQPIVTLEQELAARFPNAPVYADNLGTAPALVGQSVGLLMDKSRGGPGPELNRDPAMTTQSLWISNGSWWTVANGVAFCTTANSGASLYDPVLDAASKAGKSYEIRFTILSISAGAVGAADVLSGYSQPGTYRIVLTNPASVRIRTYGITTATITGYSVRELPGNHASQATPAARPILGRVPKTGRRNLLTYSDDLTNASWTMQGTVKEAGGIIRESTASTNHIVGRAVASHTIAQNQAVTARLRIGLATTTTAIQLTLGTAVNSGNGYANFGLSDGAVTIGGANVVDATITPVPGIGWDLTFTALCNVAGYTGSNNLIAVVFINDSMTAGRTPAYVGTGKTIHLIRAQVELNTSATAHQVVTSDYDVTEEGVPSLSYLQFDGTDDFLSTPAINFTATDEMFAVAGVRRLASDSTVRVVAETGVGGTAGSFALLSTRGTEGFGANSSGSTFAGVTTPTYPAVTANVLSLRADVSADALSLFVNGSAPTASTADQGTGNYGNLPLYIGGRAGTGNWFNGQLFGLAIRGKLPSDVEVVKAEKEMAGKSGVTVIHPAVASSNLVDGGYIHTVATVDPATGKVSVNNPRTDLLTMEEYPKFGTNQWVVQVDNMWGKTPACDLLITDGKSRSGDPTTWQGCWAESLWGPWKKFDSVTSDGTSILMRHNTPTLANRIFIAGIPYIGQQVWDTLIAGWTANPLVSRTASGDTNFVVGTLPAITARNIPAKQVKAFKIGTGDYHAMVTTGVHSEEHVGMHTFIGFIDFVLSNDPVAVNLRNRFTFYCYPNLNPQARYVGAARLEVETLLPNANRIFSPAFDHINLSKVMRTAWEADTPANLDLALDFHDNPFGSNYAAEMLLQNAQTIYTNVLAARLARLPTSNIRFQDDYAAPDSIRDYAYERRGARTAITMEHGYIYSQGPDEWKAWGVDLAKGLWTTYENPPAKPLAWQDLEFIPRTGQTFTRDPVTNDYLISGGSTNPAASVMIPPYTTVELIFDFTATGAQSCYVRSSNASHINAGVDGTVDLSGNLRAAYTRFHRDFTTGATPLYVGIATNFSSGSNRVLRVNAQSKMRAIQPKPDTFAGTDGTDISKYTGESGYGWNAYGAAIDVARLAAGYLAAWSNSIIFVKRMDTVASKYTVIANMRSVLDKAQVSHGERGVWPAVGLLGSHTGFYFRNDTANNRILIEKRANNVSTILTTRAGELPVNTDYTVSMAVDGTTCTVSVNGVAVPELTFTDAALAGGAPGIRAVGGVTSTVHTTYNKIDTFTVAL